MHFVLKFLVVSAFFFSPASIVYSQDNYVSPRGHSDRTMIVQTLREVFNSVQRNDFAAFLETAAERYVQHSPDLPDGWKPVWDLLKKRPEGFSSTQMQWLGNDGFLDNGRYLIMMREVHRGDGTPPSKIVDIMLFDEIGKYAEHWDIRQNLSPTTASGRSETEADGHFTQNPVNYSVEQEEANKKTVMSFLELAFGQNKLEAALDRFVAADWKQHTPNFADGTASLKQAMEAGKLTKLTYDVQLVAAQNDLVVVFARVTANAKDMAVVDIHRVRDGKLVEHWDVIQPVPADVDMPHTNGMFYRPRDIPVGAIELISYKPKQGVSVNDALALDTRIKYEYVVKQPGYISRQTGVAEDGTIFVHVFWDTIASVQRSQAKGMTNALMGEYMQIMDQSSVTFHNIEVKQ